MKKVPRLLLASQGVVGGSESYQRGFTFDTFPEVVPVPADRGELAQVVVGAPDVDVFILRATHDVGEVVAANGKNCHFQCRLWAPL